MTVEVAQTINELNPSYPRNVDLIREGDDHIRLTKRSIKTTFPNINSVVQFGSEKLNHLNVAVESVDKDGNLVLSKSLTMKRDSTVNMTNARVENVGDAKDPSDAITLKQVKDMIVEALNGTVPIGHIQITADKNFDPKAYYGIGEWKLVNAGHAIMGAGKEFKEDGGLLKEWFVDERYGTKGNRIPIAVKNLPPHSFTLSGETDIGGRHWHPASFTGYYKHSPTKHMVTDIRGVGPWEDSLKNVTTDWGGEHKHQFSGKTETIGDGEFIDITPQTMALYFWRRMS